MGTYGLNQILLGSVKVSRYLQAAHDLTPLAGRGSQEQWPVASECEAEEIAVIESAKDGNGDAASIDRAEKLSASLCRSLRPCFVPPRNDRGYNGMEFVRCMSPRRGVSARSR